MKRTKQPRYFTVYDVMYLSFSLLISYGIFVTGVPQLKQVANDVKRPVKADASYNLFPSLVPLSPTPSPKPQPIIDTPEKQEIVNYISEVFGDYSQNALYLLTCENADLNPGIINTAGNYPEGSKDVGIFQVNQYWQGMDARFLTNWKINVLAAYQIFSEDGYSFKLWTCGRKLGI